MAEAMDKQIEARKYHLPPTSLIPNSPLPLLHYPELLRSRYRRTAATVTEPSRSLVDENLSPTPASPTEIALRSYEILTRNTWQTEWIYRYGPTQASHYHSRVHECMVVLCGTAKIRFGREDDDSDKMLKSEDVILDARPGDVFIVPAGIAHKTHDVTTGSTFALLTPGNGHGISASQTDHQEDQLDDAKEKTGQLASNNEIRNILSQIEISGFAMLGAYPISRSEEWDFATGGEDVGRFEEVWKTPLPELDPVLGSSVAGLCSTWNQTEQAF